MQQLTIGTHLYSQVCTAEVIVVRGPSTPVEVDCGGLNMGTAAAPRSTSSIDLAGPGALLGKRYVDAGSGLELLCVKPGSGTLSVAGAPLPQKSAKQLPASD